MHHCTRFKKTMSVHSQLTVNKIIHGVGCPHCGGELIASAQKTIAAIIIKIITLGYVKAKCFQCTTCGRIVQVF
jgi:predicted RNA-binding Zn-ribbon protein involved in translation (DUF1610 family)